MLMEVSIFPMPMGRLFMILEIVGMEGNGSPNGVRHYVSEGEDINDHENYQDDYQDDYYQQDYQNDYYDDESTQYIPSPRTFILASETNCTNT